MTVSSESHDIDNELYFPHFEISQRMNIALGIPGRVEVDIFGRLDTG